MPWLLKRSYAIGSQSFRMLYISYKKKIVAPLPHGISLISRQAYKKMVSRYYAACFERPLNLFKHNTISGLGQCRDGSNINTSSQCQCLSQDLHFFPKKELFNFFRELFAKESSYPSTTKLLDEACKQVRSFYITCTEYTKQKQIIIVPS